MLKLHLLVVGFLYVDTTKINSDAYFDSISNKAGFGIIVRNHNGVLIDGLHSSWTTSSSLAVEGLTLR